MSSPGEYAPQPVARPPAQPVNEREPEVKPVKAATATTPSAAAVAAAARATAAREAPTAPMASVMRRVKGDA